MGGLKTIGAIFQQDWRLKGECYSKKLNPMLLSNWQLLPKLRSFGVSVGQIRTTFDIVAFTWSQRNDYRSGASVWTSLCAFGIKRLEDSGNSGTKPPQTSAGK